MNRTIGIVLILLSAVGFGFLGIFARFAFDAGVGTETMLFLRFLIATVCMLIIVISRRLRLPPLRTLGALALLGGVLYVAQALTYFTALTYVDPGLASLLLYFYPVLVTLLSVIFLHERLSRVKIAALLIALVGTALTANPGNGGRIEGVLLSLLAGAIYAVYIILSSRITRGLDAFMASAVIITSACVVYGVLLLLRGYAPPTEAGGWWAIVGLALVSTILPFVTFLAGLERVGASSAAVLSTLEPVVAVVASVLLFGIELTLPHLIGGVLVLTAVVILTRQQRHPT
ncbi:MAG: DMT family transporter [Chloroflexota bacterium]|nr:DMT family transporter [Chloroflexota bacterium]